MRLFFCGLLTVATLFSGCTHKVNFADFERGEAFDGAYNKMTREVQVTLPTGELLIGTYSAMSNASFSFGSANVYSGNINASAMGYGISAGGNSQAYAMLKSQTSKLMMEMIVTYSEWNGHGFGEARTNDGRKYKVSF